ncbi:O-acetyltransferase WecH [Sodalis praecaptivus]|nr:O-acetyltransferase WecH [Sodalis praecaptivus]
MTQIATEKKFTWIDNLRGCACMMVVMIDTTTYYVTHGNTVGEHNWMFANMLNSASRVAVPLFMMMSGYLFYGERAATKKHLLRLVGCLLFYSAVGLIYMALLTPISAHQALSGMLQKPAFYHLWYFYAVIVLYLLSPLIQVKALSAGHLAVIILLAAVLANPHSPALHLAGVKFAPINLFINGDMIYYLLYAILGRAIGMLTPDNKRVPLLSALVFLLAVALIAAGTKKQLIINGDFADTFYEFCGPLFFIAAVSLFIWFKSVLDHRPLALLSWARVIRWAFTDSTPLLFIFFAHMAWI